MSPHERALIGVVARLIEIPHAGDGIDREQPTESAGDDRMGRLHPIGRRLVRRNQLLPEPILRTEYWKLEPTSHAMHLQTAVIFVAVLHGLSTARVRVGNRRSIPNRH